MKREILFRFIDSFCIFFLAGIFAMVIQSQAEPKSDASPSPDEELRPPEYFNSIPNRKTRSQALFTEAFRVIRSPRCLNCHPNGDTPTQGIQMQVHYPSVKRGPQDRGVVGMQCSSCHQDHNLELARVPGSPEWHLAPLSQAWVGKSAQAICEQLKDRKRNGNKSLSQIVEHSAHDRLVAWGWAPGAGRTPAPGTQERFGALMSAWAETGAECPKEEK